MMEYDMPYHIVTGAVEVIGKEALDKLVERGYVLVEREFMKAFRAGSITPVEVEDDRYEALIRVAEAAKRWRKLVTIDAHMDLARAVDELEAVERGGKD